MIVLSIVVLVLITVLLTYHGRGYWALVFLGLGALALWGWWRRCCGISHLLAPPFVATSAVFVGLAVLFGFRPLRRSVLTWLVMRIFGRILPPIGETERIALEAGTVWWDGELFSGNPNWKKWLDFKVQPLSDRERAFLSGQVEHLCTMLNDWEITQRGDMSKEVWDFIKRERFLGMIIPEQYGGLGFSALAHSAVVTKLASRSVTAAVTVMVPNSLGPAELLLHYGTEEQKQRYLPKLATGEEIPCFALTGPEAGSDAAATQSIGVVCRGVYEGKEVLGMRLNWRKRYITLGPISTVIGLAFRLKDPDQLLGQTEDLGITCALIPSHLPGIDIGKRHDPMGIPFYNGPNEGKDVFVPIDFIIGGQRMAGQGWRMLMESLAAGRSISLPALSTGAIELAARVSGAYSTVREQFDTPIGRFEGIEEPLARIGGLAYLANAARVVTAGSVDAGEKPSVVSAIVKCYLTDAMRAAVIDAMDIRAGAGICRGPRNVLAQAYMAAPIGITVEGANILTRSMIIYGQGAIRCHPYVRHEMEAAATRNLASFDRAFFKHVSFIFQNVVRTVVLGLTDAALASSPVSGTLGPLFRQFSRMSTAFALVSDVAMGMLGGKLKRREKISGRLADVLAWLYLGSAAMKRFYDEGQNPRHVPLVRWACFHALYQIQQALFGILDNFPNKLVAFGLRRLIFPWGASYRPPSDAIGAEVARALLEDKEERLHLTHDIYVPPPNEIGLGRLEAALDHAVEALEVEARIRDAVRAGKIDRAPGDALVELALQAGIITPSDRERIHTADQARNEVIQVDAFDPETFRTLR